MPAITSKESRTELDYYVTPHWMTQELLKFCPIEGRILEPCAGEALGIASRFSQRGHKVTTADINPGAPVDYHLDATDPESWPLFLSGCDWTVTNPPFSLVDEILPLAYEYSKVGIAFLLRGSYFEPTLTGTRARWLKEHPLTMRITMPRFAFSRSKKTGKWQVDSATTEWFIWRKDGWKPENPFIVCPAEDIEGYYRIPAC